MVGEGYKKVQAGWMLGGSSLQICEACEEWNKLDGGGQ